MFIANYSNLKNKGCEYIDDENRFITSVFIVASRSAWLVTQFQENWLKYPKMPVPITEIRYHSRFQCNSRCLIFQLCHLFVSFILFPVPTKFDQSQMFVRKYQPKWLCCVLWLVFFTLFAWCCQTIKRTIYKLCDLHRVNLLKVIYCTIVFAQ